MTDSLFYFSLLGLLALYAIIPILFLHFLEYPVFKTRYITFARGYLTWFIANVLTFLTFISLNLLIQGFLHEFFNIIFYFNEFELIFVFAIELFIVTSFIFIWFFKHRFNNRQIFKITSINLAFYFVIAFTIFGLHELLKYNNRYAGAIYAKSPEKAKTDIIASIRNASKLKFPENINVIFAHWGKPEMCAFAKFEMDPNNFIDFESRLNNPALELNEVTKDSAIKKHRDGINGWGPKRLWKPLKSKNFRMWKGPHLEILLDFDNSSKIVVYLLYYTV